MRLQIDDVISELRQRLKDEKSIRNTVWLKNALQNLEEYKRATEKKPV